MTKIELLDKARADRQELYAREWALSQAQIALGNDVPIEKLMDRAQEYLRFILNKPSATLYELNFPRNAEGRPGQSE